MTDLGLEAVIVTSEEEARSLVNFLLSESQYFSCEPLPDGWYEIQFKAENLGKVRKFLGR